MKAKELREMTNEELNAKIKELKQELFNLRFSHATGQLTNPMQLVAVTSSNSSSRLIASLRICFKLFNSFSSMISKAHSSGQ